MQYKFRGKRIDNKEWVFGNLLQRHDSLGALSLIEVQDKETFEIEVHQVYPESVGMWTGLRDKNGKDIYEGDLIRFAERYLYVVKFEDAKFVGYHANNDWGKWGDLYMLGEVGFTKYNYVVIGNVHDNAELLTPAKGAVNYNMKDPNLKAEEATNEQATEQQAAAESAAQDAATGATESAEEGGAEG